MDTQSTPPPVTGTPVTTTSSDERTWSMLVHLSALAGFIVPFGNIIGPLLVWQIKKNEMPSIEAHGKEALNFQISMAIYFIVAAILTLIAIGILLMFGLAIFGLVCTIMAGLKANNGELWRYPLTIRLLK
jgi:uncharacterized protein